MSINYDPKTVEGFGEEWSFYNQSTLAERDLRDQFDCYFALFPWKALPKDAVGFDMGCGSGRWAKLVAPRVGRLYCIDASREALEVAKSNLEGFDNCVLKTASFENIPLEDNSMDFGYSLGVLHHIPNTAAGIRACVDKLKPGASFLLYIYYAFDNRPWWFRLIWRITDFGRRIISELPFKLKRYVTQAIALTVYYPLARVSLLLEKLGVDVDSVPLAAYRERTFYTMQTDALDRFGTRLEKRFTAAQIRSMMEDAGLERIQFSNRMPYWCAIGFKRRGEISDSL